MLLLAQGYGGVALVMPQVQVGFGAVFGNEDLAVLEGVHGAGVHVDVRVQLLKGDSQAPGLQQRPDGRRRHPLAQGGQHPAGDKDQFGLHKSLHIPTQPHCQYGSRGLLQFPDFKVQALISALAARILPRSLLKNAGKRPPISGIP